jgi:hypothetical protein
MLCACVLLQQRELLLLLLLGHEVRRHRRC